jgi:hypothetical protein
MRHHGHLWERFKSSHSSEHEKMTRIFSPCLLPSPGRDGNTRWDLGRGSDLLQGRVLEEVVCGCFPHLSPKTFAAATNDNH